MSAQLTPEWGVGWSGLGDGDALDGDGFRGAAVLASALDGEGFDGLGHVLPFGDAAEKRVVGGETRGRLPGDDGGLP